MPLLGDADSPHPLPAPPKQVGVVPPKDSLTPGRLLGHTALRRPGAQHHASPPLSPHPHPSICKPPQAFNCLLARHTVQTFLQGSSGTMWCAGAVVPRARWHISAGVRRRQARRPSCHDNWCGAMTKLSHGTQPFNIQQHQAPNITTLCHLECCRSPESRHCRDLGFLSPSFEKGLRKTEVSSSTNARKNSGVACLTSIARRSGGTGAGSDDGWRQAGRAATAAQSPRHPVLPSNKPSAAAALCLYRSLCEPAVPGHGQL